MRNMGIINLARSSSPSITLNLFLPSRTPAALITELIEAMCAYVAGKPQDWVEVQGHSVGSPDYKSGAIEVQFYLLSPFKRVQVGDISQAKGRAYIFLHEYARGAGIEMVRPTKELNLYIKDVVAGIVPFDRAAHERVQAAPQ